MTQKQTILGRISQLAKANINSLLDRAEDPEKMLDQLVRDYTNSIAEAEEAVAQTIANVRMAEADLRSDEETAQEWGRKAAAANSKAEELRGQGDAAGASKFENLTRIALQRQIQHENDASAARPAIEQQNVTVEKLKEGLVSMKTKLEELKSKRGTLVARARSVEAQAKVNDAMRSIDVMDPTSDLGRFEEKIKREEALVAGRAEAQTTSIEDQFDELEDHSHDAEIEARLAALRSQG
ncbi:PspA/IM30 family protein [Ornithinimicrobium murale]|uniref:PspA/IM30 family protein n=1 Tax=Ornithinimicrobium murale TaxID=1050153 RepID=UPI000E0DAC49|nr:PspA/IM30 family protein [Ornithinimicrobium murale]